MEKDNDIYQEVIEYDDGDNFLDLYLNWWPDEKGFEAEDEYYGKPLRDVLSACLNENLQEAKRRTKRLTVIEPGYQYKDENGSVYTLYGEDCEEDNTGITYEWDFLDNNFPDEDIVIFLDESLQEAKKDEDELPPDPGAVKVEVHSTLNNLVADEIEAIDGYEEAKADIQEQPIEHKDEIIATIDHIKDEEKEHIDELINATAEIPFEGGAKEEAPAIEEPVVEEPVAEPVVEEELTENTGPAVKVGDTIKITKMDDPYVDYVGKTGKVDHIDDAGQLHGTWGGCAVIPGEDEFVIVEEEALTEEKAKPEGDKKADYEAALKLAAAHNKPVIYGYSNKSYNGKYFTLDDPIVCNNVFDETKKFKQKYKSCGTTYVAYPDDYEGLRESYRFSEEEQEKYNCDEDGCYEENGHWGRLVKCGWCEDFYDADECKFEVDFGWLCDRCQDELQNHGGPLMFIEPAPRSCDEEDELEANLHKNKE